LFFDEFSVTLQAKPLEVLYTADYYAYGEIMREWKHADLDKHRYGYQGDFAEKDWATFVQKQASHTSNSESTTVKLVDGSSLTQCVSSGRLTWAWGMTLLILLTLMGVVLEIAHLLVGKMVL
jgi:hypothetical protein